jgi:phosphatidylglycerophosphatase C
MIYIPLMADNLANPELRWVAIFDLDGTLTWRDTFFPYILGYLRRHPLQSVRLWRLPLACLRFVAGGGRGQLKSEVIRMVMGGASRASIDAWTEEFVASLVPRRRFRPAALAAVEEHRRAGDHLVLLSASPSLYVPRIGRALRFERTLCTEVEWRGDRLDGSLKTLNRRGAEKTRCLEWLRSQYPGLRFAAYGNSASDLDHMSRTDRGLLVNGDRAARVLAAKLGVPTSEWR